MAARLALLALLVAFASADNDNGKPAKVCYFDSKAEVRTPPGLMKPSDIDANLCTHIVYCFAKITTEGKVAIVKDEAKQVEDFKFIKMLKGKNPELKILLGVAGYEPEFIQVVTKMLKPVIQTLKTFVEQNGFDGVDIFMHSLITNEDERIAKSLPEYVIACKEIKKELGKLLVTATYHPYSLISKTVPDKVKPELKKMIEEVDMINLATFNLIEQSKDKLAHHTSLAVIKDIITELESIIGKSTESLLSKITLGLATFGRTFVPETLEKHTIGSTAKSVGPVGPIAKIQGILATYEICPKLKELTIKNDKTAMAPYAYNKDIWICYDNVKSMMKKIELVWSKHFGGVSVWSLDMDDFKSECKYPETISEGDRLMTIRAITKALRKPITAVGDIPETLAKPVEKVVEEIKDKIIKPVEGVAATIVKPIVRACYYNSKARTRTGLGKFTPEMIPTDLCTHIYYAFAHVNEEQKKVILTPENIEDIKQLMALKQKNPLLKIILGLNNNLDKHLDNLDSIKTIASSLAAIVKEHGLDGVDIFAKNMEIYAGRKARRLLHGLQKLCIEIKQEVSKVMTEVSPFLLTLTVHGKEAIVTIAEDLKEMLKVLDWMNVVMYDLITYRDPAVGHHSPLTVIKSVIEKLAKVIPVEKIVLGLAAYGRTFKLSDEKKTEIGSPAVGPGVVGEFTGTPGSLAMFEICKRGYKIIQDPEAMVPYGHLKNEWISFDDLNSIRKKVDFALEKALRGLMVWSIDRTDHQNTCGKGKHPFLVEIKTRVEAHKIVDHGKEVEVTTKVVEVPVEDTVKPSSQMVCHSIGLYQAVPFSNWWCTTLCELELCSSSFCRCY